MVVEGFRDGQETAVLCSGGLDSAVLVADERTRGWVQPVYVSTGLAWEAAERRALDEVLSDPCYDGGVRPVASLRVDMSDVYPAAHWALRGTPPAYDTPDEDVYLVGRNVILLSKAGVFCAERRIGRLALGPLAGNPFPDATPQFFDAMARALSLGLAHPIELTAPFANMHKDEVIQLGVRLGVPLGRTLSCMNPQSGHHCGACSKCRERRQAFRSAGVPDPTTYARSRT
jgi:7-cyano-7-deazaguanine synthase